MHVESPTQEQGMDWCGEIAALKKRVERLEARHDVVAAAAKRWRLLARARRDLVFSNEAGALAHVPEELAVLIRDGERLDVDVVDRDGQVVLQRRGQDLAVLPKALALQLPELLAQLGDSSRAWRGRERDRASERQAR